MNTTTNPAIARDAAIAAVRTAIAPFGLTATFTIGSNTRIKGLGDYDEVLCIGGNTFAHKDAIKAAGGRWSAHRKEWVLTIAQAQTLARAIS